MSSENESLKAKIKTLKHTKKALNLEKEQLEKKDESSKKSKTKNSEKSSESKKKVVQKPKGKSKKIEDGQTSLLPEDKSPTPTPPDG